MAPSALTQPPQGLSSKAGVRTIAQGEVKLKAMTTNDKLTIEIEYCAV